MSIIEVICSTRGKCVSCAFFRIEDDYWPSGKCINENAKIRYRERERNSKCGQWKRNVEFGKEAEG
jgi:hypothetical protein